MKAFVNRVSKMNPAESDRCRQDDNVPRPQAIHRLLIGIKAKKPPVGWDINLGCLEPPDPTIRRAPGASGRALQSLILAFEAFLEEIGHRHQLDRTAACSEGVRGCARAASTT